MELKEIIKPITADLEEVKKVFYHLLDSRVRIINIIARHLLKKKGKWLRPILVIFSGRLCGKLKNETYTAAALLEMLHNATLIHDDVVDDATVRRGSPTLNAVWKNKITILMGDYILARSLTAAAKLNSLEAIDVLSNTSARMSQGEISQLIKSRKKKLNEEEYFEIIGDKTASLLAACCKLGGLTVSTDKREIDALNKFGENLGLAFQIKDDLLDLQGEEKIFGKKKGTDIKNGKITLPLIYALNSTDKTTRNKVLKKVKKKTPGKDVKYITDFISNNGGIEYAQKKAEYFSQQAKNELAIFPDSHHKDSLFSLTDYITNRVK